MREAALKKRGLPGSRNEGERDERIKKKDE
jgi:hypothetical protein